MGDNTSTGIDYLKRLDRFSFDENEMVEIHFTGSLKEPSYCVGTSPFSLFSSDKVRCCRLKSGLTSDYLAAHPAWIDDLLEKTIQTEYPNLETIILHLPRRLTSMHRFLRTVETIIFPFLQENDSNEEKLEIVIHRNNVRIGPRDKNSTGKEVIIIFDFYVVETPNKRGGQSYTVWDPLVQKILKHFQGVTTAIELHTNIYLAETFETICSICCAELHTYINLDEFAAKALTRALKGNRNRKRKRRQSQNLSNALKVLGLHDVKMNSSDFLSLCKMMEENQSIEVLRISYLELEERPPPTITKMVYDSLMGILTQNRTLQDLYFTAHLAYPAETALFQLRTRVCEILMNHNGKIGRCFLDGVVECLKGDASRGDVIDKIRERLDLNYLCLTRIMNHAQSPCTAKVLGDALVRAAEKDMLEVDEDDDWEPPCHLSNLFRVFQTHPVLVQLIPTFD